MSITKNNDYSNCDPTTGCCDAVPEEIVQKEEIIEQQNESCDPATGCCSPSSLNKSRRDFIKTAALSLGALALPTMPVFAGPFMYDEKGHLIPEDKKLSAEWIKSLYERGLPEVFSSKKGELKYIGMPIGGMACGQLYLAGDGKLWLWHIFKTAYSREKDHGQQLSAMTLGGHYENPDKVFTREDRPVSQGAAIRIKKNGSIITKQLDSTGFKDIDFRGEYPIGKVTYNDASLPVEVRLEAFSPFIPLNTDDSSLPVTIMSYKIKNTSSEIVEVELASWLENAVCPYSNVKDMGVRRNALIQSGNRKTILSTAEALNDAKGTLKSDIVFEDFENGSYKRWKAKGVAFGKKPVSKEDEGFYEEKEMGTYYVSSGNARELDRENKSEYNWGRILPADAYTGTLTSKSFTVTHNFITFLMAGGYHPGKTALNLIINGKTVISVTSNNTTNFEERFMDVRNYIGKKARLQMVDEAQGSWASIAVDHIVFTDKEPINNQLTDQHGYGSMALSLYNPSEESSSALNLSNNVNSSNVFDGLNQTDLSKTLSLDKTQVGALGEKIRLQPGEEKEITYILSWFFPNLNQQEGQTEQLLKLNDIKFLKKHYANWFRSANQVADYITNDYERLIGTTRRWNKTYYDATLPYWLLDRSFIPINAVATNTLLRFDNGRVWAWEGVECCPGTCQHVWQYAQGMARIFPQMEKTLREVTDFDISFKEDGGTGHRDETAGDYGKVVAHDGHAGTIMRAYREHKISSDSEFLKRNYTKIKKAVQFLINEDKDKDGLLEGGQHNTLDASWYGPMGWISSLYIGAMAAGKEMAVEVGDTTFAKKCDVLIQKGRGNLVSRLYNGEYFIHEVDPNHPKAINSNDGCHIDQVLGQSFASQYGISERIVPEQETKSALESIWKYNFAPDAYLYQKNHKPIKGARIYATEGEAGTIMCTWPKSDGDKTAVPGMENRDADSELWLGPGAYFDEAMNGFEYQVATHMIWEGMLEKGLATARAVHDRYHPLMRNPYNEIECSDHYSRSMASYGVFLAVCGFDYHGPKGHLSFNPKLTPHDFKAPFTTAEGWGAFSQKRLGNTQENGIEIIYGKLSLSAMSLNVIGGDVKNVTLKLNNKRIDISSKIVDGSNLNIKFESIILNEKDKIAILIG